MAWSGLNVSFFDHKPPVEGAAQGSGLSRGVRGRGVDDEMVRCHRGQPLSSCLGANEARPHVAVAHNGQRYPPGAEATD